MAELKRKITKAAGPVARVQQSEAEGLARFFRAAYSTLMPDTFNVLCARSGIDALKEKPKSSEHGPCWECRFFDQSHCAKWDAVVPVVAQIDGCAEHKAVVYTAEAQKGISDLDLPF